MGFSSTYLNKCSRVCCSAARFIAKNRTREGVGHEKMANGYDTAPSAIETASLCKTPLAPERLRGGLGGP